MRVRIGALHRSLSLRHPRQLVAFAHLLIRIKALLQLSRLSLPAHADYLLSPHIDFISVLFARMARACAPISMVA